MAFAPLSPELKQRALSIASSFAKGGTVAAFQEGGQVSEDDLAAAVTEADDLNEALDNLSERDSDSDNNRDYEEAVADALAGGMDLNQALDVADEAFGDGGDGGDGAAPPPRDDATTPTPTAAESILASRGISLPDSPEAERIRAETAATLGVLDRLKETIPEAIEKNKKVTDVPTKQIDFTAPSREEIAAAAGVSREAIVGSGKRGQNAVMGRDGPVMSGRSVQQEAAGQGTTVEDIQNRISGAAKTPAEGGTPAVDADDMAGIGSVAPRSTVQAPPSGGIADLGPVSPDELDEIQDFEDMVEAERAAGTLTQQKKAGLAGLGVLAGSPMLAAAPVARDIFKTLTQPDVKAGELLAGKGLGRNQTVEEVVNDKGQRVGVVVSDPTGVVSIQPTSISNSFDPALRDAYSKLNERESREREGRGDDREPITEEDVAVEEEAAPEKPPTIDIVPFRPQDFYYFYPRQQYGLPSMMNARTE